jgi:hypothetical protein
LNREVTRELRLPLYYTGLTDAARIAERDGEPRRYELDRSYNVTVPLRMSPNSTTWFVIE